MSPNDENIKFAFDKAEEMGLEYEFEPGSLGSGFHPNSVQITLENDKEVDKKLVSEEKTLEPQNKIIVYGTKKHPVGKVITGGRATYYYGPTIAACNLFPKGTKLKVTNILQRIKCN